MLLNDHIVGLNH